MLPTPGLLSSTLVTYIKYTTLYTSYLLFPNREKELRQRKLVVHHSSMMYYWWYHCYVVYSMHDVAIVSEPCKFCILSMSICAIEHVYWYWGVKLEVSFEITWDGWCALTRNVYNNYLWTKNLGLASALDGWLTLEAAWRLKQIPLCNNIFKRVFIIKK